MERKNRVISYDELLKSVPNRYYLAVVVGKRYREISMEGIRTNSYLSNTYISNAVYNDIVNNPELKNL